jgi:enoyl-CoA hydratase
MPDRFETVRVERPSDQVLLVTLHRPAAANAMNTQMGIDLLEIFAQLFDQPDYCRAVVLTGAGERVFCAGGDLKERNGMSDAQWQAQHLIFERMIKAVIDCPMPVIAAVGAAYAGGCEIALGCDFVYAAPGARFALTEVTIGIMPGAGGTQNLPRAVGERRAKEIILTGRPFTAEEAYQWGMVNRLCELGQVVTDAIETANTIAANAITFENAGEQQRHRPGANRPNHGRLGRAEDGPRCARAYFGGRVRLARSIGASLHLRYSARHYFCSIPALGMRVRRPMKRPKCLRLEGVQALSAMAESRGNVM